MADERILHEAVALLRERTGLDFSGARGNWLRDFLATAERDDETWCARLLGGDADAFTRLCEHATVQESYFFREPATLRFLTTEVLPALRERPGEVRVWSAGCAGGQESYTLAMLLADSGLGDRSRVLGTDLSEAALQGAREAAFGPWSMRGVDATTVERCFRATGKGFTISSRLRGRVDFEQHNLLSSTPPSQAPFDLVLCRNVLIYLTPEAVYRAGTLLAGSVRPGGWLVTGISDPLLDGVEGLEPVALPHGTVYRRRDPVELSMVPVRSPRVTPRSAERRVKEAARTSPATHPATPASRPSGRSASRPSAMPSDIRSTPRPNASTPAPSWSAAAEDALLAADPHMAERLARAALTSGADRTAAYSILVRALCADARLDEALDVIGRGVDEIPVSAELRALHSAVLLDYGRAPEARDAARQSLYLDPASPLAHLTLARSSELLGDVAAARRARRNGRRILGSGGRR